MNVPKWSVLKSRFPVLSSAIAYGSSVFPQHGNKSTDTLTDLMFVVKDAEEWHRVNLELNPHDYSRLARNILLSRGITVVQEWPGGMWFNAGCLIDGIKCKYGVISQERAIRDLTVWRDFTFAGRLHKPVLFLEDQVGLMELNSSVNRPMALMYSIHTHAAKGRVEWRELLETIVGLSYQNDVRMWFAEDTKKVQRIVSHQFTLLQDIYKQSCKLVNLQFDDRVVHIDGILDKVHVDRMRVMTANAVQSVKGLASVDPGMAWQYLCRKVKKRLSS